MSSKLYPFEGEEYNHLAKAVEQDDYYYLLEHYPIYAAAVENEVNEGKTAEGIYLYLKGKLWEGREGLAKRCENAARYLIKLKAES